MANPFPVHKLPSLLQQFVCEVSESLCCDPSFVALPAISSVATAIGNTRSIQIRQGWIECSVVWTALVADSGSGKSPALRFATKPLLELQSGTLPSDDARVRRPIQMPQYVLTTALHDHHDEAGEADRRNDKFIPQRMVTTDVTIGRLAQLLRSNPRGLLLIRHELGGWVNTLNRRVGSDFWLTSHEAGPIYVDRNEVETALVRRACVSITGGFQPEILRRVLLDTKHRESGLAARFLFSFPPKRAQLWTDRVVTPELEGRYRGLFLRLFELRPTESADDPFEPEVARLLPDARMQFIEFHNRLATEQISLNWDLAATWSKLRGYAARLALIIEFARWAETDEQSPPMFITQQSMEAGIALASWFAEESRKVYAIQTPNTEIGRVERVLQIVRNQGGQVTANELRRLDRLISDESQAEVLLNRLVKAGLGQWQPISSTAKGGRPTRRFILNSDYET